jgi:hypothetical protein
MELVSYGLGSSIHINSDTDFPTVENESEKS